MKKQITYILLLLSFIAGCKKYDDGPWLSLRTREARITGIWHFEYFEVDGVDSTSYLVNSYNINPTYSLESKDKGGNQYAFSVNCIGSWGFYDHHKYLWISLYPLFTRHAIGPYETPQTKWTILRLTNKELWLKTEYNQKHYIAHLKKTKEIKG